MRSGALSDRELTRDHLAALLDNEDERGVLSIFLDGHAGIDASAIDVRGLVSELRRSVVAEGPPDRADALLATLTRLGPELELLYDGRRPGRGRAVFVWLSGGVPMQFETLLSLSNRVVIDDRPFVHPLVEVLERGRPAGVVLFSGERAELFDWRSGRLVVLCQLAFEGQEPHLRSAPVGRGAARHPHADPGNEHRRCRDRERRLRFVDRVAELVADLVHEHGWERAIVSGDERLTKPLIGALPRPLQEHTLRDPRQLIACETSTIAGAVGACLDAQRAQKYLHLARQIHDAASAGTGGAIGLSEVAAALNEDRVEHLIYDPRVRYAGAIPERRQLLAPPEGPPDAALAVVEPRLMARLVRRTLETGARATPLDGEAAELLAAAGGIAAKLRG